MNDLEELPSVLINIILHTIPMILKWVLCDTLQWVRDPGAVGLAFWYLLSLTLSYVMYRA